MSKFIARARHLASRFGAEDEIEKEALKHVQRFDKNARKRKVVSKKTN